MEAPLPIYINNSTSIFSLQQCELGTQDLFSGSDFENLGEILKYSLETFLSLELPCYQSRALLRLPRTRISTCRKLIKCDIRVQELMVCNLGNENLEEQQELALSRYLVEVLKCHPNIQKDIQCNNFPEKDTKLICATGKDLKVLKRGIMKTMKVTVLCSSPLQSPQEYFESEETSFPNDSCVEKPSSIYYRRNLSNWKFIREKIRDIFQSYEIHAKSNSVIDLRSCSLSKLATFICPGISFVFINECSIRGSEEDIDIARINARTKIIVKDIHHVDYFFRLYTKHIPVSTFSSALNVDSQKVLIDAIETRLKIQVLGTTANMTRLCTNFLVSGPKSSGKKLLVKEIAKQLRANLLIFDVSSESLLNINAFCNSFRNIFDSAVSSGYFYPTILLLLRLDLLFTDKKSEIVSKSNQSSTNKKKLVNLISDSLDSLPKDSLLSVISVTDRPYLIHPKLRRSGRLEREISVKAPTTDQRFDILSVLTKELPSFQTLDLRSIAEMTPGYVGTDLRRLVNLALLKSNEEKSPLVSNDHIKYAFTRVLPSVLQGSLGVVDIQCSVSLDQIVGLDSVKSELIKTIVWPIRYPSSFRTMGITPAKGILIFGPPGCAKTTLVRAIASSNQTNFLSVSAAELYTSGVGDSEKLIADLYNRARLASPCVVFIDELELIVSARTIEKTSNSSNTSLLSMLLTEMDGIGNLTPTLDTSSIVPSGPMVITVAATNRPDLLDSALLRPGRFDRIVPVPPPDQSGRLALLKEITKNIPLLNVDLNQIAEETEFFSGADLVNLCQEAALCALGEDMNIASVTMANFETAKRALGPSLTPEILQSFYEYAGNFAGKLK